MSAAALKVALSFSGKLFTELTYRIWQISPRALECFREMHGHGPSSEYYTCCERRERSRREVRPETGLGPAKSKTCKKCRTSASDDQAWCMIVTRLLVCMDRKHVRSIHLGPITNTARLCACCRLALPCLPPQPLAAPSLLSFANTSSPSGTHSCSVFENRSILAL